MWHVACDMLHVACDMWHVSCCMWHVTYCMWHVACNMWHVTFNMQHAAYNMWNMTSGMHQMTCDMQYVIWACHTTHALCDMRHVIYRSPSKWKMLHALTDLFLEVSDLMLAISATLRCCLHYMIHHIYHLTFLCIKCHITGVMWHDPCITWHNLMLSDFQNGLRDMSWCHVFMLSKT